jgi:hypothetical protein
LASVIRAAGSSGQDAAAVVNSPRLKDAGVPVNAGDTVLSRPDHLITA